MKFKVTVAAIALMMANSLAAQDLPYYTWEEISVNAEGALYGPFPIAMADNGAFIGTYSMKASLRSNVDIGLPFTFNKDCQYDNIICDLKFYGAQTAGHDSYYNAYKAWRNAQSEASNGGYISYMMGNVVSADTGDIMVLPFDQGENNTDVKVTGVFVYNSIKYIIGYSSAPYIGSNREFVRRAFIQSESGDVISLMADFLDSGGFSSAYNIKEVNGKVYVIGTASRSYPLNNLEYFNQCYHSTVDNNRYSMNDLVYCPGFDTQAWIWDVTGIVNGSDTSTELTGIALASMWLNDNPTNDSKSLTYSANAFDINASGIAVGASTFEYQNDSEGGRQRAIIMTPTADGVYGKPIEITAVNNDIEDQEDWIYNTWALTISDTGLITGNREFYTAKGRNEAIEFFVYDSNNSTVKLPLLDKKVATTKQRLESGGSYFVGKKGANSRVYDANEAGLIVGEIDDFDQLDPVYLGSPRSQAAFIYDNTNNKAWYMNDLLCSQSNGVVTSPRIRIRTAHVINETGIVLAAGFVYTNDNDYRDKNNGQPMLFKLTPNSALSPDDSPNCWESSLLKVNSEPYVRSGAASLWLWLFALPLVFVRRFKR